MGIVGRRFLVDGRVQGVGYRAFVQKEATRLGLDGFVKNLEDGRVEVSASGPEGKLAEFTSVLRKGPAFSAVRHVAAEETAAKHQPGFRIKPY